LDTQANSTIKGGRQKQQVGILDWHIPIEMGWSITKEDNGGLQGRERRQKERGTKLNFTGSPRAYNDNREEINYVSREET